MALLIPTSLFGQSSVYDTPVVQLEKFNEFYRYLTNEYVDSVEHSKLIEKAVVDVLAELDPHSSYMSREELADMRVSISGEFSGIGIEFQVLNDTLIVVNALPGGPAEKVGVLANDKIVIIDGESVVGISRVRVPQLLRGTKGTEVNIGILRRGVAETLHFRIVRDRIPISTVDAAYKLDESTGYIKINRFGENTMKEFYEAIGAMGDLNAIVLDLRGNGGGVMEGAIEMSNFFLPRGSAVLSTEGLHSPYRVYNATQSGKFLNGKVVVLIDEFSASASEIVAGALQDWDRAVVIGRQSFGKGLVQRIFPLVDNSAIRLTVSKYFTPTGRAIQRPFEKGKSDEYYLSYMERVKAGTEGATADTLQKYTTLRLGKKVYGGGGIYPDIYIQRDTTGYSDYLSQMIRMGVINEYVTSYLDRRRTEIEARYPDFESYDSGFHTDEAMMAELAAMGEARGVAHDPQGAEMSRELIGMQIKALIAQKVWSITEYFRIMNAYNDNVLRKATEVIRDWDTEAAGIATDNI